MMTRRRLLMAAGAAVLMAVTVAGVVAVRAQAPASQTASQAERTVWYFYRVKWGYQDEFLGLFRKNHYPVLQAQVKSGRMTSVRTFVPTYHGDGRADWTFAVAITFKDTAAMNAPSGEDEIVRKLFPDQNTFRKEEQRRFELLDAHWDVPLNELVLTPAAR
jgi:hypothetical protein